MAYAMTKRGSLDNCITYEFMCDTVADMNAIEDGYRTLGSVAIVLNGESGSLEVYITDSSKEWHNFSAAGGGGSAAEGAGLKLHLCTQDEVEEGLPNISSPDENTIYLVPGNEEENNLYEEYFYIDDGWEKFGSAGIDLSGYYQKPSTGIPASDLADGVIPDTSVYAPINSPNFTGSISLGRAANTTIGAGSVAEGTYTTASGAHSHAEGASTTASGSQSHAEGTSTTASGLQSHAEGSSTIASGIQSHTEGNSTTANGNLSHAEGYGSTITTKTVNNKTYTGTGAHGANSHSEGQMTWAIGESSHAEGTATTASGAQSHAEGANTTASNTNSHAEGGNTIASGSNSHAEGNGTTANGPLSHAEGSGNTTATKTVNNQTYTGTGAYGYCSHSEGSNTWSIGSSSHAEGDETTAIGNHAHAEGYITIASGDQSHAEGKGNKTFTKTINNQTYTGTGAYGQASHVEGNYTWAIGAGSHAEGGDTIASGADAHAEGAGTSASGYVSHAEGADTQASGNYSHAEGRDTITSGLYSHAEGNNTIATGENSHTEGKGNKSSTKTIDNKTYTGTGAHGQSSHAEGENTWAIGNMSHAEGSGTTASGIASHAEGGGTTASGAQSHAEGSGTTASGSLSHAEGGGTKASGTQSHAEGSVTTASGSYSHAEGSITIATGASSHVGGEYNIEDSYANWSEWTAGTPYKVGDKVKITTGSGSSQTIQGYICKTANSDSTFTSSHWINQYGKMNYVEIIGNGMNNARSNARALDWDGNEHLAGDLYVHCNTDSTGGTKVATTTDLANKLDKPSNVPAGKFLQTDSNGNAVWGDGGSSSTVEHVFGQYNNYIPADSTGVHEHQYVEVVGNGVLDDGTPVTSNARTLDWNGNEWIQGDLTVRGGNLTIGSVTITEQQLLQLLEGLQ